MGFQKATKRRAKLRMALIGPTGSGKTYTGLAVAKHLGQKVAVIDTEHGSASKYADLFNFDVVELNDFSPSRYIEALHEAAEGGYDVCIVDSLTHAWVGKGGVLDIKDRATKNGNSFNAWATATPEQNKLVEALLAAPMHLIVTLRSKMDYIQEKDPQTGKTKVIKVGMAPVQRDGVEYEFDVIGDLDQENVLSITKTRCSPLRGQSFHLAGKQLADTLRDWLEAGAEEPQPTGANGQAAKAPAKSAELLKTSAAFKKKLLEQIDEQVAQGHVTAPDILHYLNSVVGGEQRHGPMDEGWPEKVWREVVKPLKDGWFLKLKHSDDKRLDEAEQHSLQQLLDGKLLELKDAAKEAGIDLGPRTEPHQVTRREHNLLRRFFNPPVEVDKPVVAAPSAN